MKAISPARENWKNCRADPENHERTEQGFHFVKPVCLCTYTSEMEKVMADFEHCPNHAEDIARARRASAEQRRELGCDQGTDTSLVVKKHGGTVGDLIQKRQAVVALFSKAFNDNSASAPAGCSQEDAMKATLPAQKDFENCVAAGKNYEEMKPCLCTFFSEMEKVMA